jgi:hypothetical protein
MRYLDCWREPREGTMNIPFLHRGSQNNEEAADPISMLKQDHSKVKDLFSEFEKAKDKRSQMRIAKTALDELKVHAAIEEEIFYPAVRGMVKDQEIMAEANEEHHVAHVLIDELEQQDLDSEVFHAKFIVLAENIRHHIREEEGEMMPRINGNESQMQELGARMAERKQVLAANPDAISSPTNARPRTQARGSKAKNASRSAKSQSSSTRSASSSRTRGKSGAKRSTSRKRAA